MISPDKALDIIFSKTSALPAEKIGFLDSLNRILTQDIKATMDLPPFDRSSMDGFAVRSIDTKGAEGKNPVRLKVVGMAQAGGNFSGMIKKGETVKIMTGAPIPKGADSVLIKENAIEVGGSIQVLAQTRPGENIRYRGDDTKKGETIILKGSRVTAGIVALLASLGVTRVSVACKPRAGILVTGDELIEAKEKLRPGKIRSANQYALYSQVKEAGGEPIILGIVKDERRKTKDAILKGLRFDVLLISGGVSVGDFDLVPKVLKELGTKVFIQKVAIQPGKPLLFGKYKSTYVFGLPGNPVSTMISFYKFVWPCLLKLMGASGSPVRKANAVLQEDIKISGQRTKILRAVVIEKGSELFVRLASHQGSGNILSVAKANCLLEIKEGINQLRKGQRVEVQYLP